MAPWNMVKESDRSRRALAAPGAGLPLQHRARGSGGSDDDRAVVSYGTLLTLFFTAEPYHQNYLALHLTQPYIVYDDLPTRVG